MIPVSLAAELLRGSIPAWNEKAAFRVLTDPARSLPTTVMQREFVVRNVNVDCNQVARENVKFKVPLASGEELVGATAVLSNVRNVGLQDVRGVPSGQGEVSIDYAIAGMPQNISTFFNCAGGGQAQLKVVASVKTLAKE